MKKKYALTIFFGVIVSMMITLTIQFFADKERPIEQNAQGVITQSMLHDFLPPTSFPSDHATVSFSLAFTCL
jgi:membrane-associated phospholipid phosphatase